MAYLDNIEEMYKKLYNSKQQQALQKKNQDLAGLQTEQSDISNQYTDLLNGLKTKQTDAQQGFYQDRNNVALNNAQRTQEIRDYMAKNNLMSSGENPDAIMRANTDLNNNLGNIYSAEKQSDNYYAGQMDSTNRDKLAKLTDLANRTRLVNEGYNSDLQAYKDQLDAQKLQDVNAYNQQQEQFKQQLALRAKSSSGSAKQPSATQIQKENANKAWADYRSFNNAESAGDWLLNPDVKQQIIYAAGYDVYNDMFKDYQNQTKYIKQYNPEKPNFINGYKWSSGRQLAPE